MAAQVELPLILSSFLAPNEISSISKDVRDKLEKHFKVLEDHLSSIKEDLLVLKTTSGSECDQLQKLLNEKENNFVAELSKTDKLTQDLATADEQNKILEKKIAEAQGVTNSIEAQLNKVKAENAEFSDDKNKLLSVLEGKNKETVQLKDELKSLAEQLAASNKDKCNVLIRAEELQSEEVKLQYAEKRLQQELQFSNQQIALLNTQISDKNQQICNLNSKNTNQILQLQTELDSKTDQVKLLEEKCSSNEQSVTLLEKQLEARNNDIDKMHKNHLQTEIDYQNELKAQRNLCDCYKKSSEEHAKKVDELINAVSELQKFIETSTKEHDSLQQKMNENNNAFEEANQQAKATIDKLQLELKNANDLIESRHPNLSGSGVESLYPEAMTTSKLMKSGQSLTSLYTDYCNVQQQLLNEKQNNERLKEYLDNVVQEVETNAPFLLQQKDEHETALATITALNLKLDQAIMDRKEALEDCDYQRCEAQSAKRENKRMSQEVIDLSYQVKLLLKEIEIVRGNYVEDEESQVSSSDQTASAQLITKRLVTFKNIQELQEQNSQLLAVVRKLSEEQELNEKNSVDERTGELMEQIESMKRQLDDLCEARNRQQSILDSVIKQRDSYKFLVSQNKSNLDESSISIKSSESAQLNLVIEQMKSEERRLKEESSENLKILTEQLDSIRNKSFEIKLENGRLSSQNEILNERIDMLQLRLDSSKKENQLLVDKNTKQTASIAKHEEKLSKLTQEVMATQTSLSTVEVSYENLKNEFNMLKNREEILVHERDNLIKERTNQGQVLANVQTLQANLERMEAERKINLQSQMEKMEKENNALREKVDNAGKEYKDTVNMWQAKVDEINGKYNKQSEHVNKLELEHKQLTAKLNEARANAKQAPSVAATAAKAAPVNANNNQQVSRLNAKVQELTREIDVKSKNLTKLQGVMQEMEKRLNENDQAATLLQKGLQTKLDQSNQQLKKLEDEKHDLLLKNQQLFNENNQTGKHTQSKVDSLQSELMQMKVLLQNSKDNLQAAQKSRDDAIADSNNHGTIANQAEEKYKNELLLHAKDIEELNKVKSQMQTFDDRLNEVKTSEAKAVNELQEVRKSFESQKELLTKDLNESVTKMNDVNNQNDMLHQQIQLMNTQLVAMKQSNQSSTSLDISFSEDENKSSQQLLEVIKYLRKEKELQSTLYDSEKAENARLLSQKKSADDNVKMLQDRLEELQKQSQSADSDASVASKHVELMNKVQMMNVLQESNSMLRHDKQSLQTNYEQLQKQVEEMKNSISEHNANVSKLSSDKESAMTENGVLRSEVKRWQLRVKQLTEQTNKFTPADLRKLNEEIESLKTKCESLTSTLNTKNAEMTELEKAIATAKTENQNLREKCTANETEIGSLKDSIQNSSTMKELVEKRKFISQVKNIAKKYKDLYATEAKKTKDLEASKEEGDKSLTAAKEEAKQKEEQLSKVTNQMTEGQNRINELNTTIQTKSNENQQLQTKIDQLNEELIKTKVEADKIVSRSKAVCNKASSNVNQLKSENESLQSQMEEYKLRLSTLQSQHEGANARHAKQIESLKQQSANEGVQEELIATKKQLDELKKQLAKPSGPVGTSSETPTANIKPMSTPVGSGSNRPPQRESGPSGSVGTSRTNMPTASIKPIAIGSSAGSPVSRTATVMPTTTTVVSVTVLPQSSTEDHGTTAISPPAHVNVRQANVSGHSQQAPTVAVLPNVQETSGEESASAPMVVVTPHVEPQRIESSEVGQPSVAPTIRIKRQRDDPADSGEPIKRVKQQQQQQQATVVAMEAQAEQVQEEQQMEQEAAFNQPSTSAESEAHVAPEQAELQADAAQDDDDDVIVVESDNEDIHNEQPDAEHEQDDNQRDNDDDDEGDDDQAEIEQDSQDDKGFEESEVDDEEEGASPEYGSTDEHQQYAPQGETSNDEQYDEEDEDDDEEDDEGEQEDDGDDDDEEGDDDDDDEGAEQPGTNDDDVIEIIDEPGDDVQTQDSSISQEAPDSGSSHDAAVPGGSQQSSVAMTAATATTSMQVPTVQVVRAHVSARSERLPSFGRQQLAPFGSGNQAFEEGDDSIVPSTPTLIPPRRNDGFAEAVSSPQVLQARFIFSNQNQDSSTATAPGVSLASQALGVDDTRMDLQFDEATTGRSVPTTPQQVASPSAEETSLVVATTATTSTASSEQPAVAVATTLAVPQISCIDGKSTQTSLSLDDHVLTSTEPVSTQANPSESPSTSDSSAALASDDQSAARPKPSAESSSDPPRTIRRPIVWDSPSANRAQPPVARGTATVGRSRQIRLRGRSTGRQRPGQRPGRGRPV